jgi:hypothetical protein
MIDGSSSEGNRHHSGGGIGRCEIAFAAVFLEIRRHSAADAVSSVDVPRERSSISFIAAQICRQFLNFSTNDEG